MIQLRLKRFALSSNIFISTTGCRYCTTMHSLLTSDVLILHGKRSAPFLFKRNVDIGWSDRTMSADFLNEVPNMLQLNSLLVLRVSIWYKWREKRKTLRRTPACSDFIQLWNKTFASFCLIRVLRSYFAITDLNCEINAQIKILWQKKKPEYK